MRISVAIAMTLVGCGCATQSSPQKVDYAAARAQRMSGAPIGLARVESDGGVVKLQPNIEHVFYPGNTVSTDPAKPRAAAPKPPRAIAPVVHSSPSLPAPQPQIKHSIQPAVPPSDEEINRAWLRYCKDAPEMSGRDWKIVMTTKMPASVQEDWDKHCVEGS